MRQAVGQFRQTWRRHWTFVSRAGGLAARNAKWVMLMRRTLQRYGIDQAALGLPV